VTAHGLRFLDCPVSGTSGMVERGDGVIFVGGDEDMFRYWEPVLASILPRPVHIGGVGQAMALKLVANLLVALHSAAAAEALVMARQAGLDVARALAVLTAGAGRSRMLEVRGPMMVQGEFEAQMKLDLFMKDLHLIQDAAAAVGAPTPLTDAAERLYGAAQAAGYGSEDLAVVVRSLETLVASPRSN
jgi:L-threonate 2-dehydrogenase